jgi:uncharacterized protein YkwD
MRKSVLASFIAGFTLLLAAGPAAARDLSAALVRAINGARTSRGLVPLKVDRKLTRVARLHSADMLRRHYFDHRDFGARMRASGARGPAFGEALGWESGFVVDSIVDSWLASAEHRPILLRAGFRRIGIGALAGSFSGTADALVVTADFAGW